LRKKIFLLYFSIWLLWLFWNDHRLKISGRLSLQQRLLSISIIYCGEHSVEPLYFVAVLLGWHLLLLTSHIQRRRVLFLHTAQNLFLEVLHLLKLLVFEFLFILELLRLPFGDVLWEQFCNLLLNHRFDFHGNFFVNVCFKLHLFFQGGQLFLFGCLLLQFRLIFSLIDFLWWQSLGLRGLIRLCFLLLGFWSCFIRLNFRCAFSFLVTQVVLFFRFLSLIFHDGWGINIDSEWIQSLLSFLLLLLCVLFFFLWWFFLNMDLAFRTVYLLQVVFILSKRLVDLIELIDKLC